MEAVRFHWGLKDSGRSPLFYQKRSNLAMQSNIGSTPHSLLNPDSNFRLIELNHASRVRILSVTAPEDGIDEPGQHLYSFAGIPFGSVINPFVLLLTR